ncbi:M23 family metallopeptidase [Sporosarcina sp. 179-K 3D1 HS]|uniref:peptidoglycan DD-metalloendopeptidase family protein n=1 Tax=Sporosarcina sp. 179-K 3D1 HS TaxID=3232169 RepID=UPI0039A38395
MREEKPKSPSQKNKSSKKNNWFWPVLYSAIAVVFVGMIWGYNAFMKNDSTNQADLAGKDPNDSVVVETNAGKETLKYPFAETLLDDAVILHEYYDAGADEEMRESALLVFDQKYVTNSGLCISVAGEPFEVVAAMSGKVKEVINDPFKGSEVTITHSDGMETTYGSLTGILVKPDQEVVQGQPIATATENEWNPEAGIYLHFEVKQDGVTKNPRTYLGFQ